MPTCLWKIAFAVCAFHLQGPNHVWQASSQTRGWLFQPNNEEEIIQEIVTKQAITLMHAGFLRENVTFCFNYLRDMSAQTETQLVVFPNGSFIKKKKYFFICGCAESLLLWGFSLVIASGGSSWLGCAGFSLLWGFSCAAYVLGCTRASVTVTPGPQSTGSVVVALRLSCSAAHGFFLGHGLKLCLQYWQAGLFFFFFFLNC